MYVSHPIDIVILVGFLVANLVVGLRHSRSIKTFQDYALGGRNFSTAVLVATIVATWITGRYLTVRIANVYQNGFYAIVVYLCELGTFLLTGWLFAMRMGPFLRSASIAEAMGNLYGAPVRTVTAILSLNASVGLASFQLISGEKLLGSILGWGGTHGVVIVGGIIIVYAVLGGVRAVTFTDVLQFFTFGTLLPILALTIWNDMDDSSAVSNMLREVPQWNLKQVLTSSLPVSQQDLLTSLPLFLIPAFSPAIFQRAIMAKNVYQLRSSFLRASLVYLLVISLVIWIAALIRTQNPALEFDEVFPYIAQHYTPVGLRGLLLAGFIAMLMSTIDSNLNAAGSILANDIVVPFIRERSHPLFEKLKSDGALVMIARVGSLVLGLLALLLALYAIEREPGASVAMAWVMPLISPWNFYMAVVSVPLLLSICGFRSSQRVVLGGMAAGFVAIYLWVHLLPNIHVDSSLPGMLINLIVLMGGHYLLGESGGWQPSDPTSPLVLERTLRREAWKKRWETLRAFRLYPYLQQNLPVYEGLYFSVGLYTLAVAYVALYTIGKTDNAAYRAMCEYVGYAVLPVSTAFLTFPIWPHKMRKHPLIAYLWPIGIGTTLLFVAPLLAILSHFHLMQVMVVMINFLMAILLLHWPLAVFLLSVGVTLAVCFFKLYTGMALPMRVVDLLQFRNLYGLLIFLGFVVAFFRGKQVYRELVASHAQLSTDQSFVSQLMLGMFQQKATVFRESSSYPRKKLKDPTDTFRDNPSKEQLRVENEGLHRYVYHLDTYNQYLKQALHRTQHPMLLTVESIALRGLWQEALEVVNRRKGSRPVVTQYHTTCKLLRVDPTKVQRLMSDALTYVTSQYYDKSSILLGIEDTQLAYTVMSMPGYVKHVRSIRITVTTERGLPRLQNRYLGSMDHVETAWPENVAALPLVYNQQIVEAHYGHAEMMHHPSGLTLTYVIPWDVREVRPLVMDQRQSPIAFQDLDLTVSPVETAFCKAVYAKASIKAALLEQAMRFIKEYYGNKQDATGESYFLRAIAMAKIVLGYTADPDTLLAVLMYGIVDETHCSLQQIALHFNPVVKRITDGVARVDSRLQSGKKLQLSRTESIQKMLETRDERVLYVELASRLHDVRKVVAGLASAKQVGSVQETLDLFVPVAAKIGLKHMAEELRAQCLIVLHKR